MHLSVVIPAYNEEKRLPETLKKVEGYLSRQDYDWEVLIVNDGSKDKTARVVLALIGDIPSGSFRLIDNKENKGKGGVVKQGMLEAKGDWRLFMDADNSTDIAEIEKLWPYALGLGTSRSLSGSHSSPVSNSPSAIRDAPTSLGDIPSAYEVIIGSRYLKADSIKVKQPLMRRIVSRMGNWLTRILLGINMVDTQCGFKLVSAKAAVEIFPKQTIMRWGFDMEILAITRRRGYQIKEVAVDWYDDDRSTVKKSAAVKTLKELLLIKWNLMRGKYS